MPGNNDWRNPASITGPGLDDYINQEIAAGRISGGGGTTLPSNLVLADATTATSPDGIVERHTTSGTSAPGFGLTDAIELQNGSGTVRRVTTDVTTLTTVTNAAEEALRLLNVISGGNLLPVASFNFGNGSGSGAQIIFGNRAQLNGIREFEGPNRLDMLIGGVAIFTALAASLTIAVATQINGNFGFNKAPVGVQNTTGTATGFTAGAGTAVNDQSTFTGGTGATAYRISDIILALKNYGLLAA